MGMFGLFFPSLVTLTGFLGISFASVSAIMLFNNVSVNGVQEYFFGNWPAPIGIEYTVDHLNALMILLKTISRKLQICYTLIDLKKSLMGYIVTS